MKKYQQLLIQAKQEAALLRKAAREQRESGPQQLKGENALLRSKISQYQRENSDLKMELSLAKAEQDKHEKAQLVQLNRRVETMKWHEVFHY